MHGLKSKSKTVYSSVRILANNLHKERRPERIFKQDRMLLSFCEFFATHASAALEFCFIPEFVHRINNKVKNIILVSDPKRTANNCLHYSGSWVVTRKLNFQSNSIIVL